MTSERETQAANAKRKQLGFAPLFYPRRIITGTDSAGFQHQGGVDDLSAGDPSMSVEPSAVGGRRYSRLGKYEVLVHLASGGMGAVYKAMDTDLGREVALKILSPDLANKPALLERFQREARHIAQLRHPNIVKIYEFGETHGTYFLAPEFVNGVDLYEHINRK